MSYDAHQPQEGHGHTSLPSLRFLTLTLSCVASEKYLGVYVRQDFKWNLHIDQVISQAAKKLGFIRRNLRGAPRDCKRLAYISLVCSAMQYTSVVRHPYTKANSDKLERIQ